MLRKRTQAQRDAINARARAAPRPLSSFQAQALACMRQARNGLVRGRAGWGTELEPGRYWQSQTIRALLGRGFCRLHARRFAIITAAGKRELARHRGGSDAA